jgi:UDP-glucose 4-epimerase
VHCASERFAGAGMAAAAVLCQSSLDDMEQLLGACVRAGETRAGAAIPVVYASDASVYGPMQEGLAPLDEQVELRPCTAAGYCHWMNEQLLLDYRAHHGLPGVILRRFCLAGADPAASLGEDHVPEQHLLPSLFEAMTGRRAVFELYGSDYPTPDGTCVRDLVHVRDVARAHVLAVTGLLQIEGAPSLQEAYNLGTGRAVSVLEVIERAKQRTGRGLLLQMGGRRHGDAACLVANASAARRDLGWRPRWSDLNSIVDTAWEWYQRRFADDPELYALAQSSGGLKLKPSSR